MVGRDKNPKNKHIYRAFAISRPKNGSQTATNVVVIVVVVVVVVVVVADLVIRFSNP